MKLKHLFINIAESSETYNEQNNISDLLGEL